MSRNLTVICDDCGTALEAPEGYTLTEAKQNGWQLDNVADYCRRCSKQADSILPGPSLAEKASDALRERAERFIKGGGRE